MRQPRLLLPLALSLAFALPAAGDPRVDPTPHDRVFQQGTSAADRAITEAVRHRVASDQSLSSRGRAVEVITENAVVVLRGPVESITEKAAIENTAKSVAGVEQVTSLLAVTAPE
jgi:osmotically-inducible protein OsmY